jgi:hypothetical protein
MSGIGSAAKKLLGISSPSKVFMGYGKNIVEGLVVGMKGNQHLASNAAIDLAKATRPIFPSVNVDSAGIAGVGSLQTGGSKVVNLFPGANIDFGEEDPNAVVQRLQNAVMASRI